MNQYAEKPISLGEALKMVRAPWTHLEVYEAAEAKRAYKRKARKKVQGQLKNAREQHKAAAMERKRGNKHRETVSDGNS